MRRTSLAVLLLVASPAFAAFDVNGVALGGSEADILKRFPSAHCKILEWKSNAADRRCDDAKIAFAGGIQARVTFYLHKNAIQAFDVRFDTRELERVTAYLKKQFGAPVTETKDELQRKDKNDKKPRVFYRVRWEQGKDHAVLTADLDKSRSSLLVSRGDFEEEIYRVR